ncbi:hypothetical protein T439DRAFT_348200 [Meredithblackwellia eburnea MCA 4105]
MKRLSTSIAIVQALLLPLFSFIQQAASQTSPYVPPPITSLPSGATGLTNRYYDDTYCFNFYGNANPYVGYQLSTSKLYCVTTRANSQGYTGCPGPDGQVLQQTVYTGTNTAGSTTSTVMCTDPRSCPAGGCTDFYATSLISSDRCATGYQLLARPGPTGYCDCVAIASIPAGSTICPTPVAGTGTAYCTELDTFSETTGSETSTSTSCSITCNTDYTPTPSSNPDYCCPSAFVRSDGTCIIGPSTRARARARRSLDFQTLISPCPRGMKVCELKTALEAYECIDEWEECQTESGL